MGNIVITKLNEDELKQIAEKTNGIYVHFESSDQAVNELMQQLSQVEKKTFTDVSLLILQPITCGLPASCSCYFYLNSFAGKKKKICMRSIVIISILIFSCEFLLAQDLNKNIETGNNYTGNSNMTRPKLNTGRCWKPIPLTKLQNLIWLMHSIKQNKADEANKFLRILIPKKMKMIFVQRRSITGGDTYSTKETGRKH